MLLRKIRGLGRLLADRLLGEEDRYQLFGDLAEGKKYIRKHSGNFSACMWYWKQIFRSLPLLVTDLILWRMTLLKSYLKAALRNLARHKGFSFINICGLAIGMACCILILLWVRYETSYDRFFKHTHELFRVINEQQFTDKKDFRIGTPGPLAAVLKSDYPEIIRASRFFNTGWSLQIKEEMFSVDGSFGDPDFLEMFSLNFVKGDPKTALADPQTIILTEELGRTLFGSEDPIGKILKVDNNYDAVVTGVIKKLPKNTHLAFEYMIPFSILEKRGFPLGKWDNAAFIRTYVQSEKDTDIPPLNEKIAGLLQERLPESPSRLFLQPITNIHLYRLEGGGPIIQVYLFSAIALFILLIASINFMNLATARSSTRAKEVGMRKVVGAVRKNLILQFIGESMLLSWLALLLGLLIVNLCLPLFNQLSGQQLGLNILGDWPVLIAGLLISSLTGFLAGIYPALFLSAFQPIKVLKGISKTGIKSTWFRRILVVSQFSLAIFLIICTGIVYNQLHYLQHKPLGFDQELLFYARMAGNNQHFAEVKQELLQDPSILAVTATDWPPTFRGNSIDNVVWEGKNPEEKSNMQVRNIDYDYFKTLGLDIYQGRALRPEFSTDKEAGLIINETALKTMGFKEALGQPVSFGGKTYIVQGVVRDFHINSLYRKIEPLLMLHHPQACLYICIRMTAHNIPETLELISTKWDRLDPGYTFEYTFMDDRIDRLYQSEQRMSRVVTGFTALAVFISGLGLFGLASFAAEQRTKEIGIRKVLGASNTGILFLLVREFSRWVVAANIIAWPLAYFVGRKWLQNFAYGTGIQWQIFFFSGLLALTIALMTVSLQAFKAAAAAPVRSIRHE